MPSGIAVGRGGDEADDDAGGVPAGGPVHRDESAVGVEVVLLERTARDVGAPARPRRHQLLHQLVRVRRSAAAGLHHLLGVLVERQQRLGRQVVLDDDEPRPGRVVEADESLPQLAGRRVRAQALHPDLLDAEALGRRGQAAGNPLDLVDGEVERRPDVQQHAVPLVATFRRAAGPGLGACPRARRAAPARAAAGRRSAPRRRDRRQVADLAQREQALVLGVARGRRRGRGRRPRRPGRRSTAKLASRHNCRRSTISGCRPWNESSSTRLAVGTGCERQVPHRAEVVRRAGAADGHDHPLRAGGERRREGLGQRRSDACAVVSPSSSHVYTSNVTGSPAGAPGGGLDQRAAAAANSAGGAAVVSTCMRTVRRLGVIAAATTSRPSTVSRRTSRGISAAVVAAGHRLEHDRTGGRRVDRQAAQQQRRQRLRAVDELGHVGAALRACRVGHEGGEVLLHRLVHGVAGGAQPRFVDDAEADLAGQVGDDRVAALGGGDQGVERAAPTVVDRVALRALVEPALEDVDDHRDLGARRAAATGGSSTAPPRAAGVRSRSSTP